LRIKPDLVLRVFSLLTISDNLKYARLVGLPDFVGREAGHGPVVQVRLGDVGQLASRPVDGELGMLNIGLKNCIGKNVLLVFY